MSQHHLGLQNIQLVFRFCLYMSCDTKCRTFLESVRSAECLWMYRRLAFVLVSRKIAHAHISGRQNKNKLKEKHAGSSEHPVKRVPTSVVSVDFEKNMPDSCIRMYKLKVNHFFTILSYTFSEMVS